MEYLIIVLVCFFSSAVGSVCGIGGGVIFKPVLDATGIMSVSTGSFLSGVTVLSMSAVSLYRNLRKGTQAGFDRRFATVLALGGVVGGMAGKELCQRMTELLSSGERMGAVQGAVLTLVTAGTLVCTICKKRIPTGNIKNKAVVFGVGILLGMMSSFLGIGGGPINLVVLFCLFSMESKLAALNSIYVILFSQISALLLAVVKGNVPPFEPELLVLMSGCGVLGGLAGSRINRRIGNEEVDKLFRGLMGVIICISIYNVFRYM